MAGEWWMNGWMGGEVNGRRKEEINVDGEMVVGDMDGCMSVR